MRGITANDIVDAIEESDSPFLSVQGLADSMSVSPQTIRNHREELQALKDVRSKKVGQATIFWLSNGAGRPKSLTKSDIMDLLEQSEHPLTVSMISEEVPASRRTVHSRVMELWEDGSGCIDRVNYGNAYAYFPKSSGGESNNED